MKSGNLFTNVYEVRERMFQDTHSEQEIERLRMQIDEEINEKKAPASLRYLLFKMTNRCNSNCEYCAHAVGRDGIEAKSEVPSEVVMQTIRDAAELGVTAMAINGGEPLLRGDILQIIRLCIENRIVPVLMTNALLLPERWEELGEAGLRYVIISFDSMIKEVYEKQRGASFEKALAGIEAAVKMKEKYEGTEVHVSAVLTRDNQDDFLNLIEFMTQRGIKVQISPFHNYLRMEDEISIVERESLECLTEKLLQMKKDGYLIASSAGFIRHLVSFFCDGKRVPDGYKCKVGYTNLFIDAYMDVKPCWSTRYLPIANLKNSSLKDIWYSRTMDAYRERMLRCDCEGCWYMCTGEVTMMLDNMLDAD